MNHAIINTTESKQKKSKLNYNNTIKNSRWSARSQNPVPSKCKTVALQLCIATRQC